MQLLGMASLALVLPVALWGWRLATHRPLTASAMRLPFWLLGLVLAAGFAACLPRGQLAAAPGLGGVVGDALLRLPAGAGDALSVPHCFAVVAGVATLACFSTAAGSGSPKDSEEDAARPEER